MTTMGNRVLVIDSTLNQKAKYIVPVINPTTSYITNFEDKYFTSDLNNLNLRFNIVDNNGKKIEDIAEKKCNYKRCIHKQELQK